MCSCHDHEIGTHKICPEDAIYLAIHFLWDHGFYSETKIFYRQDLDENLRPKTGYIFYDCVQVSLNAKSQVDMLVLPSHSKGSLHTALAPLWNLNRSDIEGAESEFQRPPLSDEHVLIVGDLKVTLTFDDADNDIEEPLQELIVTHKDWLPDRIPLVHADFPGKPRRSCRNVFGTRFCRQRIHQKIERPCDQS